MNSDEEDLDEFRDLLVSTPEDVCTLVGMRLDEALKGMNWRVENNEGGTFDLIVSNGQTFKFVIVDTTNYSQLEATHREEYEARSSD